jgi:putative ABC transport system permease protein
MRFREAIRLALSTIRTQKLKSFFTLLGVTIGVMFLIAVVAVVEGMSRYVEEDFAGKFLGVNTFTVRRFPDIQTGNVTEAMWREWQRRPRLYKPDVEAIRRALPPEAFWAVENRHWLDGQTRWARSPQVLAHAVSGDYFLIKDLVVERGRPISPQEMALGTPVVVIGQEVADYYFPNLDPIGREIRFGGLPFRVVGVLEKQGTVFGLSLDRQVLAPHSSYMDRLTNPRGDVDGVIVQAPSDPLLEDARESVREIMRSRRGLRPGMEDNFVFESSASALSQWQTIKQFLVLAGIVLPAIGLVVGAIVIMNIMLVAVAQRTREIGIRKSLGAKRRDIITQFLVESATLSTFGAALGVAMGTGLAALVAAFTPMPATVALWSVFVSVGLGAGVGIIAGAYPAVRASRLDPVVALRAE